MQDSNLMVCLACPLAPAIQRLNAARNPRAAAPEAVAQNWVVSIQLQQFLCTWLYLTPKADT